MDKKAFEMQFNWLFVLVAGAAILLFFTVVVIRQKDVADASTKATVLSSIDSIITGTGVSTDSTSIIEIPNSDIEVGCNRIAVGRGRQYQNLILFSPGLLKGNKIIAQTVDFSAPYRATNLLYMSSPQVRYIIIGSNDLAREINKSLPIELEKDFYYFPPAQIKNENNYKIMFVVFDNPNSAYLANFQKMPDNDVTAIKVSGSLNNGEIEFYQKRASSWELKGKSYYLAMPTLVGAVYSGTLEAYECSMRNAMSKFNLVTDIYGDKTRELNSAVDPLQTACRNSYASALSHLNAIHDSSDYLIKNPLSLAQITSITNAAQSLANENKNLQINSCPLIY